MKTNSARSDKSEDRNPKAERNPKSETRNTAATFGRDSSTDKASTSDLGLRTSFGYRFSNFGFQKSVPTLRWPQALLFIIGAAVCFHLAYAPSNFGPLRLFMLGYVACLAQLARLRTSRQCFYTGLVTGLICVAPQLMCFWNIFGPAAVPLWTVVAFWTGLFVMLAHLTLTRLGTIWALALVPFVWTGLEYFRSELYYLKFSWMNAGYAFADWRVLPFHTFGMYGIGFLLVVCAMLLLVVRWMWSLPAVAALLVGVSLLVPGNRESENPPQLRIAGVQLEFPFEPEIPAALDRALAKHPDADLFVLSEYTLDGPVPDSLKAWCKANRRHLIVGGKDPAANGNFYDTGFVVGPDGEIVFRQGKSVPIQFFKDGLPAPQQALWNSPWGKIGICICYDLSYTRVTDRLIRMGAELLIVPTMDLVDWGRREHELHALVAPVRAAEYGVPIFRLASSGISQAVARDGRVVAQAGFPGENETLFAALRLDQSGALPLDRWLAPFSTALTGSLVIVLICLRRKLREQMPGSAGVSPAAVSETRRRGAGAPRFLPYA